MILEPGIHYIVTKGSDDGTLKVGDHIWLEDNLVHCREGKGWIPLADTEEAMQGVEVTVDDNWLTARICTTIADVMALKRLNR